MANEKVFWTWFLNHEADLMHFETDREKNFDILAAELQKISPDLAFEFGPVVNGCREFVISAAGIKSAFPAVEALAAAAPELTHWKITAFRPRRKLDHSIELGDHQIHPSDVEYSLLRGKKSLGLYLFIPGYSEDNSELCSIGYLFLDDALGEYDVETKLGLIEMLPPEAKTPGPRYPLLNLPRHFDATYEMMSQGD